MDPPQTGSHRPATSAKQSRLYQPTWANIAQTAWCRGVIYSPGDGCAEQRQGGEQNKATYCFGVHFSRFRLASSKVVPYAATKCSPANVHTGVIKSFVRAAHSAAGGRQRVRRAAHPRRAAHADGRKAGRFPYCEGATPNLVATEGTTT